MREAIRSRDCSKLRHLIATNFQLKIVAFDSRREHDEQLSHSPNGTAMSCHLDNLRKVRSVVRTSYKREELDRTEAVIECCSDSTLDIHTLTLLVRHGKQPRLTRADVLADIASYRVT